MIYYMEHMTILYEHRVPGTRTIHKNAWRIEIGSFSQEQSCGGFLFVFIAKTSFCNAACHTVGVSHS